MAIYQLLFQHSRGRFFRRLWQVGAKEISGSPLRAGMRILPGRYHNVEGWIFQSSCRYP